MIGGVMDIRQLLVSRVKTRGFGVPIGWSHWRNNDNEIIVENALVGNDIQDTGEYGIYVGSDRLALIGNKIHNVDESHVARVWWAHLGVINHNMLSGSSLANSNGRHALKFHGPVVGTYASAGGDACVGNFATTKGEGLPYPTKFTVISNNVIGSSGPWPVSIGPQNGNLDERVSDLIFEKNKVMADYGKSSPMSVQASLMFEGRYITARNNILSGTGAYNDYTGIAVERRGIEWAPLGNRVYNNTIYSSSSHAETYGVYVNADAKDTVIRIIS